MEIPQNNGLELVYSNENYENQIVIRQDLNENNMSVFII